MSHLIDTARERLEAAQRLYARLVPYDVLKRTREAQRQLDIEARLDVSFPSDFVTPSDTVIDDGGKYGDPFANYR